jgi:hypothetical protein
MLRLPELFRQVDYSSMNLQIDSDHATDLTFFKSSKQVVAPGDVAFSLGNSNATAESVVIESSNHSDIDGICMSVSSFVIGLVLLLLLLVVASLVAAFLFVRVRSIHRKTAVFAGGFDNPEYLKHPVVGAS